MYDIDPNSNKLGDYDCAICSGPANWDCSYCGESHCTKHLDINSKYPGFICVICSKYKKE